MNEKIIRPGLIKRVVDLLKCRNKKYTQEDVENIVSVQQFIFKNFYIAFF